MHKVLKAVGRQFTEWKQYYNLLEQKGVYHSPEYIRFLEKYYRDEAELFIFEFGNDFVYYPYFKKSLDKLSFIDKCDIDLSKYHDIVSSWYYGGPLFKAKDSHALFRKFHETFQDYIKQNGVVTEFIRFDANLENYIFYTTPQFNRETIFVNLLESTDAIWLDFTSSNCRAIRKAERAGFKLFVVDNSDATKWKQFYEIYSSEMHRKKAPEHLNFSLPFFQYLYKDMSNNVVLMLAKKDNEVCGGFIIVFDENAAFHFLSATLPKFWQDRVNNLLFYKAILWGKEHGCRIFDFSGGREGVSRFKSNFSSTRREFFTYKKIHNHEIYDKLSWYHSKYNISCDIQENNYFPTYRLQ
ncbi:MAG: GNAT family N-acetyltransferase [Colwellia sp.]|nr:GNAT family N-acetyltransferase [Colwellia sp.]